MEFPIITAQLRKPGTSSELRASTDGTEKTIEIYGAIGASMWEDGITAKDVSEALRGPETSVVCRINSPGGSVFEGATIYNLLKSSGKTIRVVVDGMAASAASVVAMAGDTVEMHTGTMMMIHEARMGNFGPAVTMLAAADILNKATSSMADIYVAKTGKPKADVMATMAGETWLTADEAIEQGFADKRTNGTNKLAAVAAAFNLAAIYEKTPDALKTFIAAETGTTESTTVLSVDLEKKVAVFTTTVTETKEEGTPVAEAAKKKLRLY